MSAPAPEPADKSTNNNTKKTTADREEVNIAFAVKVKPEYVLTEPPSCLAPITEPENNHNNRIDDRDKHKNNNKNKNQSKRSKNNRGQNKKRPRDFKTPLAEKACLAVVRGEPCPFLNSERGCRYNHDLKQMLADRPEDIKEIEGGCPLFNIRGYCDFGIMCRLGSCHVNMSTGQNLCRIIDENGKETKGPPPSTDTCVPTQPKTTTTTTTNNATDDTTKPTDETCKKLDPGECVLNHQSKIKNILSKKTINELRKKKYPFVCKRHFEMSKPGNKKGRGNNSKHSPNNEPPPTPVFVPTTTNTPTLPPKERKLIDFRNKVYIAPLTTVGNLPFRRIMKNFSADITCGEMALSDQLLQGKPSEWALLKRHPVEDVFGVQIASGHADQFTRVAEILANKEEGMEVDFVDMNLGCPIDLVCEKGAGSSLMLRERKLRGSLEGMLRVLECPVTIKMRTGWSENQPIAHQLVPKIQGWGIDGIGAVMIHGRSRLQRYSREAKWDYIAQVGLSQKPDLPQIPIIGNGDIFSYTDYEEKILDQIKKGEEGDIGDGGSNNLLPTAMLGRGALIKPWLPTEIKERRHWDISATERMDMLKDFVRFGLEHWGSDQQGVNQVRRFLLEWLSFLHRYVPVGLLEVLPQCMNHRPPNNMCGRSDLETLMLSRNCADWIKISEMLLGPVPEGFLFEPKHKANSYQKV